MMKGCMGLSVKDANVCRSRNNNKLECCFGYLLKNDKCVPCPLGFYGNDCKKECMDGYYGNLCDYVCKCDERTEYCDKRLGCTKMNNSNSFWDDEEKKIFYLDDDDNYYNGNNNDDDDGDDYYFDLFKGGKEKKEINDDVSQRVMVNFAYYLMCGSIGFVIFFLFVLVLSSICLIYCKIMKAKKKKKKKEEEEEEEYYRSPIYKEPINYWHMGIDNNNCYFSDDETDGGDVNVKEDIKQIMML